MPASHFRRLNQRLNRLEELERHLSGAGQVVNLTDEQLADRIMSILYQAEVIKAHGYDDAFARETLQMAERVAALLGDIPLPQGPIFPTFS